MLPGGTTLHVRRPAVALFHILHAILDLVCSILRCLSLSFVIIVSPQGYNQLVMMEAQQIDTDEANIIAGMDIAMDVVRAAEICGGGITAADVLTLASGAQAERSPAAAAAVAARMSVLLQPGAVDGSTGQQYSPEFVLQQYEQLADMCLRFRAPVYADAVLEAAETQGLRPSPEIMQRLLVAMRGKPRRSEVRAADDRWPADAHVCCVLAGGW
jgi:hypothetical protein